MTSANHASISSSVEGTFRAHKYTYQRMSTEMDWNQTDCLDGFQCSAFSPDMGALGMIISCMATARMTLQVRLQHDVQLSDVHMYEAFGQNVSCRWGTGPASIRSSTSTTVEVQVDDIENKWVTKYGPVVSNPWEFTIEGSIHTACVSRWCIIFMSAFWTLASLGFLLEKKKTWLEVQNTLAHLAYALHQDW